MKSTKKEQGMKYTIEVGRWGAECVAGQIPDNIWKYIQDECDGDASTYREKLDEGEILEEFKLAEDIWSFYDADSFFHEYLPYADTDIRVIDEDGHVVLSCPLNELKQEIVDETEPDGEYDENEEPLPYKPCFIWRSVEKSTWIYGELELDEPFDKDKLKVNVCRLNLFDEHIIDFARSIAYGDKVFEADTGSTRGVSFELDFYED